MVIVFLAVVVGIFMVVSIAFDHSLRTFRYAGDVVLLLMAIACFSTASVELQKLRQKGNDLPWYHHPLVRTGILFLVIALFSFCMFDLRTFL
jgi:hypothetical protein